MASKSTDTWNQITEGGLPSYWKQYSRGRPPVPASFWHRLIDFHKRYGNGQFSHIHDLGSGPGIYAAVLAKYFSHVTLTDPSTTNVEAATLRLSQELDAEQFTCKVGRGEDLVKPEECGKYDMVFIGSALHWMDASKALTNIAASLKRDGTMIAVLFGFPDVTDSDARAALLEWLRHSVDLHIKQGAASPAFGKSIIASDSAYNTIKMDFTLWDNVIRVRLNKDCSENRGFVTEKLTEIYGSHASQVTQNESTVTEEDRDWYVKTDLDGLRDVVNSFPVPTEPEFAKTLWAQLGRIYESKPVELLYDVNILLATKR